jgi:hypothetical protein
MAAALAVGIAAHAEEKKDVKPQTVCPVMGGKIDKSQYIDVNGYRIYVCCAGCKSKIKADPDKFIEKMKSEGIELEQTPETESK